MRFDFYCENRSGSSSFLFTPLTYWSRGLGGAENAFVGLTTELARLGHEVHVWNIPIDGEGVYGGVQYHDVNAFDLYAYYDTFICFRNPFFEFPYIQAKRKGWWSTDQVTCGNYAADIKPYSDFNVAISPYHRQYHIDTYGFDPDKIFAIDLGVRVEEYEQSIPKVPNRLLYASVPSRGLEYLKDIFPRIRESIPDAELYITGSFSMWGEGIADHNQEYKDMFAGMAGVHYLGKIPRQDLVKLQLSSDLLVYPNAAGTKAHAELFSVTIAECQVAGCVPVTSTFGAFPTTVIQPEGRLLDGHPAEQTYQDDFVREVIHLLSDRRFLDIRQTSIAHKALSRFAWSNIANQWLTMLEGVNT